MNLGPAPPPCHIGEQLLRSGIETVDPIPHVDQHDRRRQGFEQHTQLISEVFFLRPLVLAFLARPRKLGIQYGDLPLQLRIGISQAGG